MLKVESIGKRYDNKEIVKGISLKVNKSQIVGLLGPNGAGKTTSFYMIAGLIKPDYGSVYINNQDITTLPIFLRARLGLGYLPQDSSVFRGLSVQNNIMIALEMRKMNVDMRYKIAEELMNEFSIAHLSNVLASNLSGGERRRVEIARCLAMDPVYILLDEPLAGIDPIAIHDVTKMILSLKNRGIGVLITDHNVKETLKLVDYTYIVYDGQILAEGDIEQILKNHDVKKLYLGENF